MDRKPRMCVQIRRRNVAEGPARVAQRHPTEGPATQHSAPEAHPRQDISRHRGSINLERCEQLLVRSSQKAQSRNISAHPGSDKPKLREPTEAARGNPEKANG